MTATFTWPTFGLAGQFDTDDHKPRCVGGCGQRTAGLHIPTCGADTCERVDSRHEQRRNRWADQ